MKNKKNIIIGINKNHTAEKYKLLKLISNNNSNSEEDWRFAVEIFDGRISKRFLNIIDAIIKLKDKNSINSCSFVVLSLDCILIETLNQFYHGINTTNDEIKQRVYHYRKNIDLKSKLFNSNSDSFYDFFSNSEHFNTTILRHKKYSQMFYTEFRCGLLHSAELKGFSIVSKSSIPVVDKILDGRKEIGLKVNRNDFHKLLKKEFESYKVRLLDFSNETSFNNIPIVELRKNFVRKMNYIAKKDVVL
jgi:hypothetical protein